MWYGRRGATGMQAKPTCDKIQYDAMRCDAAQHDRAHSAWQVLRNMLRIGVRQRIHDACYAMQYDRIA